MLGLTTVVGELQSMHEMAYTGCVRESIQVSAFWARFLKVCSLYKWRVRCNVACSTMPTKHSRLDQGTMDEHGLGGQCTSGQHDLLVGHDDHPPRTASGPGINRGATSTAFEAQCSPTLLSQMAMVVSVLCSTDRPAGQTTERPTVRPDISPV